jgi:hypothetical protein
LELLKLDMQRLYLLCLLRHVLFVVAVNVQDDINEPLGPLRLALRCFAT